MEWSRWSAVASSDSNINGTNKISISHELCLIRVRIRRLRTSEPVGTFHEKSEDVNHRLGIGGIAWVRRTPTLNTSRLQAATSTELSSDDSEVEREVTLNFVYNSEQKRRRIFPLKVGKSQTVRSITKELANELKRAWPPIQTTNKNIHVTDGRKVLSQNSCPAQGAKNGQDFVIHIVPEDESCLPMELEIESLSEEVKNVTGVVFAPINATIEDLYEKISGMSAYPRASLTIHVDPKCQNDNEDSDDDREEEKENESDAGEDDSSSTRNFEPLALSLDALIKDHPQIFYRGCLLKIKHEAPLTLKVRVKFDACIEVSEFSLQAYQNETVETLTQAVAKEMDTDVRRVKLHQKPEQTIRSCDWRNGQVITAKLLTKTAEVLIAHVDKSFEYSYYAEDITTLTVDEIERMVEKKHSFRHKCVRLYLKNRLLESDLTLKCAGIGMGSRLTVRSKTLDSTGRHAGNQQRRKRKGRRRCEDRSANTSAETSQMMSPTQMLKRSTASDSDVGGTASKKRRILPASTARVLELEETASATLQNAEATIVGGDTDMRESRQNSEVAVATSAAGVSAPQNAESSQSAIQVSARQNRDQMQDNRGFLSRQSRLASSQENYEYHVGMMAQAFSTWMYGSRQGSLPPAPASFLSSQVWVSDEVLGKVAQELASDWEDFAVRGLKLTVNDIDTAHNKYPPNRMLQALNALNRWRQSLGSRASKAELQRLLEACDKLAIAEAIEDLL